MKKLIFYSIYLSYSKNKENPFLPRSHVFYLFIFGKVLQFYNLSGALERLFEKQSMTFISLKILLLIFYLYSIQR